MNFNLKGKTIQIQDLVSGTSKGSGNEWRKQSFVIETEGQYPKKVCFTVWGDRIDQLNALSVGTEADVQFRVESREYNGKWYTDLTASEIQTIGGASAPAGAPSDVPAPQVPDNIDEDDMPF
jgi:hypothetical protein